MSDLEAISLKLEALGYRVTPSRRAVIAAVLQQKEHFAVDDVLSCRGAGRATVFRTIRLLTDIGAVCRVLLEDGSLHYRVSERGKHHHHVICSDCGAVQELDQCAIEGVIRDLTGETGFEIEGHWLELFGRCATCRLSLAPTA
jgi:Fur family ferric uptake transcriptional regulator